LAPGEPAAFAGFGFGGGNGLIIDLRIDLRSWGFGFASFFATADFAAGFPAAFFSTFDGPADFDPWPLRSFVVCLFVTASSSAQKMKTTEGVTPRTMAKARRTFRMRPADLLPPL
jgi:hypothetical protein